MEAFFVDYLERLRFLNRSLIATFDDLPDEALDWVPGAEMNSFCVLVIHTTASARYWIGDAALGDPSNRHRDAEFRPSGLSAAQLKDRFAALEVYSEGALERFTLEDLATSRTLTNSEGETFEVVVGWALLHALEHTGIHLGHAQITRQLWEQANPS